MVIDEADEQIPIIEEKQISSKNLSSSVLNTINSLVEKEIAKTLSETEKRVSTNNKNNTNISPEKVQSSSTTINPNSSTQPPPLVTLTKSHSPPIHSHHHHSSHNQQAYSSKGSIMRGTPISPSNKPISIDTSIPHPHIHSHHYPSPKTEYSHHPSAYLDSSPHIKSSQQHLYLQQQQQQAAYLRHYSHQQGTHNNFPPPSSAPTQYLQTHKTSSINQQQTSTNANKAIGIDTSNTDTYETLRADFVTSRYLTTTHSPNHER
jgi:hypothetical protein